MLTGVRLLKGTLDTSALLKAMYAVAEVQHIVRTRFGYGSNAPGKAQPTQWVVPMGEFTIPLHESSAADLSSAMRVLQSQLLVPFQIQKSSIRIVVVHLHSEEHLVAIVQHHIITDGLSYGILWDTATVAYNAIVAGEVPLLQQPAVQYADYADWQQRYLSNEQTVKDKLIYWTGALHSAALLELHTDKPRPYQLSGGGNSFKIEIDSETNDGLLRMCRQSNSTQMQVVFALWAILLCRHSGQSSVVVGLPYANRGQLELEGLIGYFVNTLAVLVNVDSSHSLNEVSAATRSSILDAMEHAEVPFTMVVEAMKTGQQDASRTPLFQTMVVWADKWSQQIAQMTGLQLMGSQGILDLVPGRSTFEIELHLWPTKGSLRGCASYSTDLYSSATVERMMTRFVTLSSTLSHEPATAITQLDAPFGASEQQLLMDRWNGFSTPYNALKTAPQMVEEQADLHPDNVALVFAGVTKSYRAVVQLTNPIVCSLQQHALGEGTVVGLCVQKSIEEVLGMVGIMRAQAAYVPLGGMLCGQQPSVL